MSTKQQNFLRTFFIITITVLSVWGAVDIFTFSSSQVHPQKAKNNKAYQSIMDSNYAFYALPIPHEMNFAGEAVPVNNFDVRESLDQEFLKVAYWHSEFFLYLKKAHRYFQIVGPILKKNNIPDDFKYLMVTESGMRHVASPAGAKGFWQFMTSTARSYGLEVNSEVDERYNLEKATEAACKYLQEAYNRYGNWTLAAASYNVGIGNLNKQISRQNTENYYDMLLNTETGRYVYRVLAVKTIMQNPQAFGFYFRKKDLYPLIETKTITTDSTNINLVNFAAEHKTNYKILRILNPWLKSNRLRNSARKTYKIKIPQTGARSKDYFAGEPDKNKFVNSVEL